MKSIIKALFFGVALSVAAAPGMAQAPEKPAAKPQVKPQTKAAAKPQAKAAAKAKPKAQKKANAASPDQSQVTDDDKDVDVAGSTAIEMACAHGDMVTVYENLADNSHIGMRWKKQLLRMRRVETTTGANRFESKRHGLVWIGIPAKGMLLDSKKGQQLANECRSPAQVAALAAPKEPTPPENQLMIEAKK